MVQSGDQSFSFTSVLNAKEESSLALRIAASLSAMTAEQRQTLHQDFQLFRQELDELTAGTSDWPADRDAEYELGELVLHIQETLKTWETVAGYADVTQWAQVLGTQKQEGGGSPLSLSMDSSVLESGPSAAKSQAAATQFVQEQVSRYNVFMQIDTIPGESSDIEHPRWIEVQSYSQHFPAADMDGWADLGGG